jgi:hypothetical protein
LLHPDYMIDNLVTLVSIPWLLVVMRGIIDSRAASL